jgi:hypothetical protein
MYEATCPDRGARISLGGLLWDRVQPRLVVGFTIRQSLKRRSDVEAALPRTRDPQRLSSNSGDSQPSTETTRTQQSVSGYSGGGLAIHSVRTPPIGVTRIDDQLIANRPTPRHITAFARSEKKLTSRWQPTRDCPCGGVDQD